MLEIIIIVKNHIQTNSKYQLRHRNRHLVGLQILMNTLFPFIFNRYIQLIWMLK